MEPESSLPLSQEPPTCLYPEPDQSVPRHPILPLRFILLLSYHLRQCLQRYLFTTGLPTTEFMHTSCLTIRATSPSHLIFLDLISRMTFGEEYVS